MSATLRYDLGQAAADVLQAFDGCVQTSRGCYVHANGMEGLLPACGARTATRHARTGRPPNHVVTLAVKLPAQVAHGYLLCWRCYWLAREPDRVVNTLPGRSTFYPYAISTMARKSLDTLASKLALSMGLTFHDLYGGVPDLFVPDSEDPLPFVRAIHEAPGDLVNWMALADWLSERTDPAMVQRGKVIAGWLGKSALKMKYGVPVIATPHKWRHLQDP